MASLPLAEEHTEKEAIWRARTYTRVCANIALLNSLARHSVLTSFFQRGNISDIASPSALTTTPNTIAPQTNHRSPPNLNTPTTATTITNPHDFERYE